LTLNKKILIVSECFYPEEFKINDIALNWKDRGYEVEVLTLVPTYPKGKVFPGYKNKIFFKDIFQGINVFRIHAVTGYVESPIKKLLKYINFMLIASVVAIFKGRQYDYIFGYNLGSLTDMVPGVIIRKLYKKPMLIWVQDLWPDTVYAYGFRQTRFLSLFLTYFVKFIFKNATYIAISGKGFESKLKLYVKDSKKLHYLPNWADDLNMDLEAETLSKDSKVHFTFAGNIGKVQNLENIINSFCSLPDEYQKRAQLNIVGDGSNLKYIKALAGNNQAIIFYGHINRDYMAKYYKASDFLIISLIDKPIFSVTVPAKIQTYIEAKKPILAIINGDVADIVINNNLGLYAHPSDLSSITEVFKKCIDMPAFKRSKFIENNDKILMTTFNKDTIINDLTNILIT